MPEVLITDFLPIPLNYLEVIKNSFKNHQEICGKVSIEFLVIPRLLCRFHVALHIVRNSMVRTSHKETRSFNVLNFLPKMLFPITCCQDLPGYSEWPSVVISNTTGARE